MKNIGIGLSSLLLPFAALANGAEDPSISHQLQEFLPFEHLEHGHWFGVILSIVLWASLIYALYSIARKIRKGPTVQS